MPDNLLKPGAKKKKKTHQLNPSKTIKDLGALKYHTMLGIRWKGFFYILGPIIPKSRSGSSCILVIVEQFTKWCELVALPAMNAVLTAKACLNHFIVNIGWLLEVNTDQGRNLTSDLFLCFCKQFEISKNMNNAVSSIQ